MRFRTGAVAIALLSGSLAYAQTALPGDIPAGHWARKDVEAVLRHGVMSAPGGKFGGSTVVTRTDLIHTMAAFGKSLEKGVWKPSTGRKFKMPVPERPSASVGKSLTRYELASVVARMGSYASGGIPGPAPKTYTSANLPQPTAVTSVKKTDPAYASAQYLARNRMIWPNSILAKPGKEPVKGKEAADAVAAVVMAIVALRTDEPENREVIEPPTPRGQPARTGGR